MTEITRRARIKKRQAKYKEKSDDLREIYFEKEWSEGMQKFFIDERKTLWKYNKIISHE